MIRLALSLNVYESLVQSQQAFEGKRKCQDGFLYAPAIEMWKQEE